MEICWENILEFSDSPKCKQNKLVPVGIALGEIVSIECQVIANPSNVIFEWRLETGTSHTVNDDDDDGNEDTTADKHHSQRNVSIKAKKLINFTSAGLKSTVKYRADTIDDYGFLYCQASNIIGKQDKPCVFHIIKAGMEN